MVENIELNDQKDDQPDKPVEIGPAPRRPAKRFVYATGDRPLEGYTIKRGIGSGGFGDVYYAVSDAGKEVALKHIQRNLDVELRGVSQCLNLKHPNLLALFDIRYDESGEGWVVMEYVTDESLADVIDRNPNGMPQDQIAFWLSGIAAGTHCLHEHGIVHRDLKPGNVFNDCGIIKVGDYGLSKFISTSRRSVQTESVGTFHYMAPEIGKGRYGREIDVYALGVILYEMITGNVPFDGESSQEIMMKHLTAEPDVGQVPTQYREAISRALEKNPDERLNSIPEMLALMNLSVSALGSTGPIALAPTPSTKNQDQEDEIVDAELSEEPEADYKLRPESSADKDETIFIGDEPKSDMEFGPVEHRPSQYPPKGNRPNYATAQNIPTSQPRTVSEDAVPRPLPSEPIAHAGVKAWRGVVAWFENPQISTALKIVVFVAVLGSTISLLVLNQWIVLGLLALAGAYGIYYATRMLILSASDSSNSTEEEVAPSRRWTTRAREDLVSRPWPQRMADLTGSLLCSAGIAAVLSVVIMILAGDSMGGAIQSWAPQLAWVALSVVGGSWMVLSLTKIWEGKTGDHVIRRIGMMAAGMVLGLIAFGIDAALYADIAYGNVHAPDKLWATWHEGNQPSLVAYLAYFGGLFAILRWWLQADVLRTSRLSLWAIILSGLWGFLIPFPQPWGIMLAIAISITVQLSTPWMSTGERTRLRQQMRLSDARA